MLKISIKFPAVFQTLFKLGFRELQSMHTSIFLLPSTMLFFHCIYTAAVSAHSLEHTNSPTANGLSTCQEKTKLYPQITVILGGIYCLAQLKQVFSDKRNYLERIRPNHFVPKKGD